MGSSATLGRFLVPQAVVVKGHDLVTHGPYRFLRHPVYSGDPALLLGAALGTVNMLLLALWPVSALGTHFRTRQKDALLASALPMRPTRGEPGAWRRDSMRPPDEENAPQPAHPSPRTLVMQAA